MVCAKQCFTAPPLGLPTLQRLSLSELPRGRFGRRGFAPRSPTSRSDGRGWPDCRASRNGTVWGGGLCGKRPLTIGGGGGRTWLTAPAVVVYPGLVPSSMIRSDSATPRQRSDATSDWCRARTSPATRTARAQHPRGRTAGRLLVQPSPFFPGFASLPIGSQPALAPILPNSCIWARDHPTSFPRQPRSFTE